MDAPRRSRAVQASRESGLSLVRPAPPGFAVAHRRAAAFRMRRAGYCGGFPRCRRCRWLSHRNRSDVRRFKSRLLGCGCAGRGNHQRRPRRQQMSWPPTFERATSRGAACTREGVYRFRRESSVAATPDPGQRPVEPCVAEERGVLDVLRGEERRCRSPAQSPRRSREAPAVRFPTTRRTVRAAPRAGAPPRPPGTESAHPRAADRASACGSDARNASHALAADSSASAVTIRRVGQSALQPAPCSARRDRGKPAGPGRNRRRSPRVPLRPRAPAPARLQQLQLVVEVVLEPQHDRDSAVERLMELPLAELERREDRPDGSPSCTPRGTPPACAAAPHAEGTALAPRGARPASGSTAPPSPVRRSVLAAASAVRDVETLRQQDQPSRGAAGSKSGKRAGSAPDLRRAASRPDPRTGCRSRPADNDRVGSAPLRCPVATRVARSRLHSGSTRRRLSAGDDVSERSSVGREQWPYNLSSILRGRSARATMASNSRRSGSAGGRSGAARAGCIYCPVPAVPPASRRRRGRDGSRFSSTEKPDRVHDGDGACGSDTRPEIAAELARAADDRF